MVNVKRQIRLENFFKQKLKWKKKKIKKKHTKHKTQNKTKEQSETILMDEDNVKVIIREQLTTSTAKGNLGH